jgi:hypothetical protein
MSDGKEEARNTERMPYNSTIITEVQETLKRHIFRFQNNIVISVGNVCYIA